MNIVGLKPFRGKGRGAVFELLKQWVGRVAPVYTEFWFRSSL